MEVRLVENENGSKRGGGVGVTREGRGGSGAGDETRDCSLFSDLDTRRAGERAARNSGEEAGDGVGRGCQAVVLRVGAVVRKTEGLLLRFQSLRGHVFASGPSDDLGHGQKYHTRFIKQEGW